MKSKKQGPGWSVLFLLLVAMLGLLLLESRDGASNPAHELIDSVIVVGFFVALLGWVHVNLPALEKSELEHASLSEYHVTEYAPKQPPEAHRLFPDNSTLVVEENN